MDHKPKSLLGWVRLALEWVAPGGLERIEKRAAEKQIELAKRIAADQRMHRESRTYKR